MDYFAILAEFTHLLSLTVLLYKLYLTNSAAGISGKTHLLYGLVYSARFHFLAHSFIRNEATPINLISVLVTLYILYQIYFQYENTADKENDTCSILVLVIPCAILAFRKYVYIDEALNDMSFYLEVVVLVPQMVLIYKAGRMEEYVLPYFILLGFYRAFYIIGWIYDNLVYCHSFSYQFPFCSSLQTVIALFFLVFYFLSIKGKSGGKKNYISNLLINEKQLGKPTSDLPFMLLGSSENSKSPILVEV